ncbi:Rab9 effector protein with kelch motifs isoform 2 [Schistosoma japonicum]|uniref:Rab9 effector protein with kelch motifs n=2 Tax=Schistosoma japonicum TaxID=6182 RepID=A0A4Z2CRA0_SCHJA|nr:Rab9 effector protein with kelch motifs isoform 2 [Schistosoma japonicum]
MEESLEKLSTRHSWCSVSRFLEENWPLGRVGHTAHALCVSCEHNGNRPLIIMIGGADTSEVFNEAFIFDIISFKWYTVNVPQTIDFPSLGRYEHSSAILSSRELLIFGGATKAGSLSQLLRLQIHCMSTVKDSSVCEVEQITASINQDHTNIQQFIHLPRTQHSSVSITEYDQLLVFSGGGVGSQTVADDKVYVYDSVTNLWNIIPVEGTPPCSRLGHLMLYEFPNQITSFNCERIPKGKMFIHGGMVNEILLDDIYVLHFTSQVDNSSPFKGVWDKLYPISELPPFTTSHDMVEDECKYLNSKSVGLAQTASPVPRAAHGGTILTNKIHRLDNSKLLIFGGLSVNGALNDMFCFDTSVKQWTEINYDTSVLPSPRLDFAYCTFSLMVKKDTTENSSMKIITKSLRENQFSDIADKNNHNNVTDEYCQEYLFIHGGMDTHGTVFNDAFLILLSEFQLSNPINIRTIMDRNNS